MLLADTLLWKLASKHTESQQVPDPWLWCRIKHQVHHPEGVNHFHSHPAEDAEECVVQEAAEEATHTLGHSVGYGAGEDEEHKEEEQSHNQATVHQTRLVLRFPKNKPKKTPPTHTHTQCLFGSFNTFYTLLYTSAQTVIQPEWPLTSVCRAIRRERRSWRWTRRSTPL